MAQTAPNPAEQPYVDWMTLLQSQGYTVTDGQSSLFGTCSSNVTPENPFLAQLGSCFGNNAGTPYILVDPPPGSPNNLPQYIQNNFGLPSSAPTAYNFFELGDDEALVTVITLPPPGAYFAYQGYMFERQDISAYAGTPPSAPCTGGAKYPSGGNVYVLTDDCKYQQFGYYGNAINGADIAAQFGTQFNADPANPTAAIAIVTTASGTFFNAISNVFTQVASNPYTTSALFQDGLPTSGAATLSIGLSTQSDIFGSIIRYTLPQSQSLGNAWTNNYAANILVYRVTKSGVTGQPYATSLMSESYNTDETINSNVTLAQCSGRTFQSYYCDLQEIASDLQQWSQTNLHNAPTYGIFTGQGGATYGPGCITKGTQCAGGTQDNSAYRNLDIGELLESPNAYGPPTFVVGVNHSASAGDASPSSAPINNANYTGVSGAVDTGNQGVTDVEQPNISATFPFNKPNLSGSAAAVLSRFNITPSAALAADLPNLYVTIFTRASPTGATCNEPYCISSADIQNHVNTSFITEIGSTSTQPNYIDPTSSMLVTERGYQLPPAVAGSPLQAATGASPIRTLPPLFVCDEASGGGCSAPP